MNPIGLTYCIITTICWAIGPVFLRKSLDTFDNTEINATRSIGAITVSALGCVVFNPSFLAWNYGFSALGAVFLIVILGNIIGDLFYFVAIDNIGLGRALSTSNSYPVFVALFSVYWLGETHSLKLWIGIAIIITGLALLNCARKDSLPPSHKKRSNALGFFMGILASMMWALSMLIQKWALTTYNIEPLSMSFWRALLLGFTTWVIWYFRKNKEERKHIFNVGFHKWLSPFLAGAFSLAIGGATISLALEITPVSLVTPITASNPVIAAIIARFAFNERLSPIQWFGILLVIIGGIVVSS